MKVEHLLTGLDTVQCAYFLNTATAQGIDFEGLRIQREALKEAKIREPKKVTLGSMSFLLQPYGSVSGYPLVLTNQRYRVECGEFNNPSFFVTFSSQALWSEGAQTLHEHFLAWAGQLGLLLIGTETLSRVDFTFDYHLPEVDFDEDDFVSRSNKDSQHRNNGCVQTFTLGKSDVVLRVYDKAAEIREQSAKVWFYELWGRNSKVWRIEWQVRKSVLKRFGIRTFADLAAQSGDVLRYLAFEHDTLRERSEDKNRSRWPLHPLWHDLQERIKSFDGLGVYKIMPEDAVLAERQTRLAISMYGYLKQAAALYCVQAGKDKLMFEQALTEAERLLKEVHNPFVWRIDVEKRVTALRLGQW